MYHKTSAANYSTNFYVQNETSNNEVHQEVFEELHREGGVKCVQERAWKFQGHGWRAQWGRERGGIGGEGTLLRT